MRWFKKSDDLYFSETAFGDCLSYKSVDSDFKFRVNNFGGECTSLRNGQIIVEQLVTKLTTVSVGKLRKIGRKSINGLLDRREIKWPLQACASEDPEIWDEILLEAGVSAYLAVFSEQII